MTFLYSDNILQAEARDGVHTVFALLTQFIANGWIVIATGDGLAAFAIGSNVISSSNSGANGLENDFAWFCVQQPPGGTGDFAGTRQIMVMGQDTGPANTWSNMRIVYSPGGTANTAAASATQAVAFTDAEFLRGGGTAAAPTFGILFPFNVGGANPIGGVVVGGAAENFGWIMHCLGDTGDSCILGMDPVTSTTPGDTDPFVFPVASTTLVYTNVRNHQAARAQMNLSGTPSFELLSMYGFPKTTNNLSANRITQVDDLFQVFYGRGAGAPGGLKGVSTMLRWDSVGRATKSTFKVNTTNDRLKGSDIVNKWGGSSPN